MNKVAKQQSLNYFVKTLSDIDQLIINNFKNSSFNLSHYIYLVLEIINNDKNPLL